MNVSKEHVETALASLETVLSKASEQDLDQPEGADLGNPAKEKMSEAAKSKKAIKGELKIEHESDEEEDEDEDEGEIEKKAKKSFAEDMPEEIQTKIDVSEFLKSLVDHTGDSIDALKEHIAKSEAAHETRYTELAETMDDVVKAQAKIGIVLKAICQQIGVIGAAPARTQKSETSIAKSQAESERKFSSGLETEGTEKVFKSLSENPNVAKSQIANALCEMVRKGEATDLDVIGFESGGYISPELVSKLKTSLN
jgi:hypothetical protein